MLVFVYGTLKTGKYNSHRMGSDDQFIGVAWIYGELYVDGLPYLMKGRDKILGEVHQMSQDEYESIKRMEIGAGYYEDYIDAHMSDKTIRCKVFYYDGKYLDKKKAKRLLEY